MRELIRHILKESNIKQDLKKVIEDDGLFKAADLVGGISNLKSVFKDDPEISSLFEKLTGTIIFDYYVNKEHIEFPLNYEIIGRRSNVHNTNHWPEINVIYDENKLDPEENDTFKSMIKNLADDAQHSGFKSKFDDGRIFNANYLTVVELNGENIDLIWGGHYPSIYEVEEIYDKLYDNQSLNESTVPAQVRRRNEYFDMFFIGKRKNINLCSFRHPDHLMNYLLELTLEDLYHAWFYQTLTYEEWEESIPYIENYIKEKYYGETVVLWKNKCDSKRLYESEDKPGKYLELIKDLVEPFKDEVAVCDIEINYDEEDDMYSLYIIIGLKDLDKKFHQVRQVQRNHYVKQLLFKIKKTISGFLPIKNIYVGSYSSPNCESTSINESEKNKQSLTGLIDEYGLYDFTKMSGLNFNQVKSVLDKMGNPKEVLKQYIREFVLEKGGVSGENYGSIFAVQIPLSNTKYVEDILVHDADSIAIEMWEYHLDEYGHREQKDQYLTTINSLTNDELLTIIAWMMETIKEGSWDY